MWSFDSFYLKSFYVEPNSTHSYTSLVQDLLVGYEKKKKKKKIEFFFLFALEMTVLSVFQ